MRDIDGINRDRICVRIGKFDVVRCQPNKNIFQMCGKFFVCRIVRPERKCAAVF